MTPEILASIAAILISLLFSYVPGFKTWYEPLSANLKRIIMLALILLAAAASFGLTCAAISLPGVTVTCDTPGALGLIKAFIAALIANQTVFLISPKGSRAPAITAKSKSKPSPS